jgi:predicted TIM-barrel fold metal-dependent hydrolase
VFLHCYPYHREAGYLAAVFPNVYFDVGQALNYTGPGAGRVLAEAMELAPFTKQLYSSDAFALAELHYLGALLFRRSLAAILEDWVRRDECSAAEADGIGELLGRANARRIYPLDRG